MPLLQKMNATLLANPSLEIDGQGTPSRPRSTTMAIIEGQTLIIEAFGNAAINLSRLVAGDIAALDGVVGAFDGGSLVVVAYKIERLEWPLNSEK